MTTYNQKDDFNFFLENREKLREEYPDQFLVIKNKSILGAYDDQVTAYTETTKELPPGTFIIQSTSDDMTNTQVFHSRVISV